MTTSEFDEKAFNKAVEDLIDFGVLSRRFKGIDRIEEIAFETKFLKHLHKYCKDPYKEKMSLWQRYEVIKSFNIRTKTVSFEGTPNLWIVIQAMHNIV